MIFIPHRQGSGIVSDQSGSRGSSGEGYQPSRSGTGRGSAVGRGTATAPRRNRSVSIIIPTYNERENIEQVVERCRDALSGYRFEIVVVDDDSPDRTWQFVRSEYETLDAIRVVRRTEESGLATAVSRGFDEATYDLCAVIDADLQHPPEKLPELIAAFESGADIVIGSRHVPGGGVENWSRFRRLVSRGAMAIAKLALPPTRGISDPMSGFFAVRRDILDGVSLAPTGYKILLEDPVEVRVRPCGGGSLRVHRTRARRIEALGRRVPRLPRTRLRPPAR